MSILEIKKISIKASGKTVVSSSSIKVKSGEIHILMGPNGSGKSSLLNGLMGHPKYKVLEGKLLLDKVDITHKRVDEKAKKGLFFSMQDLPEISGISLRNFLFQSYKILKDDKISVIDFSTLLEKKAEEIGISESFLNRDLNVGLSGGEKKLSEILQMVVLEPKFVLLDEIDSGVDMDSLSKVFKAIEKLSKNNVGVLLITHYNSILNNISPNFVHIMYSGSVKKTGKKELVKKVVKDGYKKVLD